MYFYCISVNLHVQIREGDISLMLNAISRGLKQLKHTRMTWAEPASHAHALSAGLFCWDGEFKVKKKALLIEMNILCKIEVHKVRPSRDLKT